MLADYFGAMRNGRLGSRRFIVLLLTLLFGFICFGILAGVGIGILEQLVSSDLKIAQEKIHETLGRPAVVLLILAIVSFVFANLNIIAKRSRDIGLPGWPTAIVLACLLGGASQQATSGEMVGSLGSLVLIALALIPTDWFRQQS